MFSYTSSVSLCISMFSCLYLSCTPTQMEIVSVARPEGEPGPNISDESGNESDGESSSMSERIAHEYPSPLPEIRYTKVVCRLPDLEEVKEFATTAHVTLQYLKETAHKLQLVVTRSGRAKGYGDRIGFGFNSRHTRMLQKKRLRIPRTLFAFGIQKDGMYSACSYPIPIHIPMYFCVCSYLFLYIFLYIFLCIYL